MTVTELPPRRWRTLPVVEDRLGGLAEAVTALRAAPAAHQAELLCRAAVETCGMERAVLSWVRGDLRVVPAPDARGRERPSPGPDAVVVPIRVGDVVVAALHAEPAARSGPVDRAGLLLLADVAGLVLERDAARRTAAERAAAVREALRVLAVTEPGDATAATAEQAEPAPTGAQAGAAALASLTRREVEVLAAMATGAPNADIGRLLFISTTTVKSHVKRILRKLGVDNRGGAIAVYLTHTAPRDERRAP